MDLLQALLPDACAHGAPGSCRAARRSQHRGGKVPEQGDLRPSAGVRRGARGRLVLGWSAPSRRLGLTLHVAHERRPRVPAHKRRHGATTVFSLGRCPEWHGGGHHAVACRCHARRWRQRRRCQGKQLWRNLHGVGAAAGDRRRRWHRLCSCQPRLQLLLQRKSPDGRGTPSGGRAYASSRQMR